MLRVVLWLVGAVIAISFIRGIVGIIGKLLADFTTAPAKGSPKTVGALKKCPSCGVYTPGEYCSEECQRKAKAAGTT